jgi:uncharacterized protein (DUF433 family)
MITTLPPFLQFEPGTDYIRLAGHRIGLGDVVRLYVAGQPAEMIGARFPTLPLALVYKVIAFYLENQVDVDAYVAADDAELLRQREQFERTRKSPTYAEVRRRFDAIRATGS